MLEKRGRAAERGADKQPGAAVRLEGEARHWEGAGGGEKGVAAPEDLINAK